MKEESPKKKVEVVASGSLDLSTLPITYPPWGAHDCYADVHSLSTTNAGVQIIFMQLVGRNRGNLRDNYATLQENARVMVPWRLAKDMRDTLMALIEQFEKLNGPCVFPQNPKVSEPEKDTKT
jgi:hypothetical protein